MATKHTKHDPPYFTNPGFKTSALLNIPRPNGWTAGRWEGDDGTVEMFHETENQYYVCEIDYVHDVDHLPDHGPKRYKNQPFTGATCTAVENDGSTPIEGAPKVKLGWDFDRCAFNDEGRTIGHPTTNCPQPSTAPPGVGEIRKGPVQDFAMPEGWTDATVSSNTYEWGINVVDDQQQLRRCYPSLLVREPGNSDNAMVSGDELTCCTIDDREQDSNVTTCGDNPVRLKFMPHQNQYRTDNVPGFISGAGTPDDVPGFIPAVVEPDVGSGL